LGEWIVAIKGKFLAVFCLCSPKKGRKMQTGRNEPCPCGSGKKFKKCCLYQNQPTSGLQRLKNVKKIASASNVASVLSQPKAEDVKSEVKAPEKKAEKSKAASKPKKASTAKAKKPKAEKEAKAS
jgi:hypothetical protein